MDPFPTEYDLIWLFEAEPKLADADAPWVYNWIQFVTDRGQDQVTVEIEPGNRDLRLSWSRDGIELTSAELISVHGLVVVNDKRGEGLSIRFWEDNEAMLWLKPVIRLEWHFNP